MPCDAVPDGNCREYRTLPDGTLEEIVGIPQTSDINNVSEGDNIDSPSADANPPGYDDYIDATAKEIAEEADYAPFDPFADDPEEPVNEPLPPSNRKQW
jgi:hypothetical protein